MENKGIKVVIEKLFSACFVMNFAKNQAKFSPKLYSSLYSFSTNILSLAGQLQF